MNGKQLFQLLIALLVLGAGSLVLFNREQASWRGGDEPRAGQRLLNEFPVNEVAAITIKNANGELHLRREDKRWLIPQRGNYRADFALVGDTLLKLRELKVVQAEAIAEAQRAPLELLEPGSAAKAGTRIEFKDAAGKSLAGLLLGKSYLRKAGSGDQGIPAGRYMLVDGDDKYLAVVSDPLVELEPRPEAWIAKDFLQPQRPRSIVRSAANGSAQWKLVRDAENADWQLADAKPDEKFDTGKAQALAGALVITTINDVVVDPKPAETGLDKASVLTVHTFDELTYSFKISGDGPGNARYLAVDVAGELKPQSRQPGADEKPEDKVKLDQAFAERQTQLSERLRREKELAKWVFLVPKWTVEPLLKERAQLMTEAPASAQSR